MGLGMWVNVVVMSAPLSEGGTAAPGRPQRKYPPATGLDGGIADEPVLARSSPISKFRTGAEVWGDRSHCLSAVAIRPKWNT
jgi:hypothetical protein